ncbi:MAG TPA: diguanylate cyclase [Tepidisphaeraceae bacterium]|nr:diguanylate cyclase [Tepidisphaeraceae bacterium]
MPQSVLIIDDSPAIHTLLHARLRDEPVALHSANSGDEGLAMASSLAPDLILLDVDMPDPNGFEVCRRIKSDPKLAATPIIFLTGAATTDQKIQGLELGAMDYITKPFDPAELRARVRGALRLKFLMDLLTQKAQIDALTGLWNRRYFDQRLEAEISLAKRSRRPLGILMLDLDHFKSINDRYGHPMGDEVLRRVGAQLAASVRTEDIVCRYGGEEFAIVAPNISAGALQLAERLRSAIEKMSFSFGGHDVKVTVSIGAAFCEETLDTAMLNHADAALYRAKQNGRNRTESWSPVGVSQTPPPTAAPTSAAA